MPLGGLLTVAPAAISAGGAIAGLLGGGNTPPAPAPGYNFKNKRGADTGAYTGTQNLGQYNTAGQTLDQYGNLVQSGIDNPYAPAYQAAVAPIGGMGQAGGQAMYDASMGMIPNVQALMQMGFDPQNALYARTAQQYQDQIRAAQGARGIQMDPYGAGLENKAMGDFNINWQNNLLARALSGAQGAGSLLGQAGQGMNTGLGTMTSGASLPYTTFGGINANALGLLQGYGQQGQQAAAIPQTQVQDYLAYLSGARGQQQANNQGIQIAQQGQQQQFAQNQALGGQLGAGLAGIGKGWGNMSNPFASMTAAQPQISTGMGAAAPGGQLAAWGY